MSGTARAQAPLLPEGSWLGHGTTTSSKLVSLCGHSEAHPALLTLPAAIPTARMSRVGWPVPSHQQPMHSGDWCLESMSVDNNNQHFAEALTVGAEPCMAGGCCNCAAGCCLCQRSSLEPGGSRSPSFGCIPLPGALWAPHCPQGSCREQMSLPSSGHRDVGPAG